MRRHRDRLRDSCCSTRSPAEKPRRTRSVPHCGRYRLSVWSSSCSTAPPRSVDSDRAEAKDCITRASSLLQREHSHADRERGGTTADTGARGPYALAGAPGEPAYRRSTGLDDQDGRLRLGCAIEHQPFPPCLQGHFRPDILQIRQPAAYRARSGADGDDGSAAVPDCGAVRFRRSVALHQGISPPGRPEPGDLAPSVARSSRQAAANVPACAAERACCGAPVRPDGRFAGTERSR